MLISVRKDTLNVIGSVIRREACGQIFTGLLCEAVCRRSSRQPEALFERTERRIFSPALSSSLVTRKASARFADFFPGPLETLFPLPQDCRLKPARRRAFL